MPFVSSIEVHARSTLLLAPGRRRRQDQAQHRADRRSPPHPASHPRALLSEPSSDPQSTAVAPRGVGRPSRMQREKSSRAPQAFARSVMSLRCPQLGERQAGVHAAPLVQHAVEVAVREEPPVERVVRREGPHVAPDGRRAVLGERVVPGGLAGQGVRLVEGTARAERGRPARRRGQPVQEDPLAPVARCAGARRPARRPGRRRARTAGRNRAAPSTDSPFSLRVSIDAARGGASSKSQLRIVWA